MKLSWIFVFAAGIQFGAGEKILAIVAMTSRSHYNLMESLCLQLTNKGHEVTLIAPFKQLKPVPRLKEIFLPNLHEEFMSKYIKKERVIKIYLMKFYYFRYDDHKQ